MPMFLCLSDYVMICSYLTDEEHETCWGILNMSNTKNIIICNGSGILVPFAPLPLDAE